jgi:hypothetical protein
MPGIPSCQRPLLRGKTPESHPWTWLSSLSITRTRLWVQFDNAATAGGRARHSVRAAGHPETAGIWPVSGIHGAHGVARPATGCQFRWYRPDAPQPGLATSPAMIRGWWLRISEFGLVPDSGFSWLLVLGTRPAPFAGACVVSGKTVCSRRGQSWVRRAPALPRLSRAFMVAGVGFQGAHAGGDALFGHAPDGDQFHA